MTPSGAHRILIDTFSEDEKDKPPDGDFEYPLGYRIPLMKFEYWQAGPQLIVKAYCYYEKVRPMFEHVLCELGGEQHVINDPQPDATTIKRARLQTKKPGRQPNQHFNRAISTVHRCARKLDVDFSYEQVGPDFVFTFLTPKETDDFRIIGVPASEFFAEFEKTFLEILIQPTADGYDINNTLDAQSEKNANANGYRTRQGKEFKAMTVKRILDRAGG